MVKKSDNKKKSAKDAPKKASAAEQKAAAAGKQLVIVESPAKAKTINKYLGPGYIVKASVGHVRDLPKSNPKGVKSPVPGVDLENNFQPTYDTIDGKGKTLAELKRMAKSASDIWLATDLDREGEAIAWHLAEAIGLPEENAKRVVFNAITKDEIKRAFDNPRPLDMSKVNAQQARRILDRIVGYQVSPLLWKKVAGGLSAGRVQSVAVRIVVEREREIMAFIPEEFWKVTGYFTPNIKQSDTYGDQWTRFLAEAPDQPKRAGRAAAAGRTIREKNAWLNEHACIAAELVEVNGERFEPKNRDQAYEAAANSGFSLVEEQIVDDPKGKGPAEKRTTLIGTLENEPDWKILSIKTKRTKSRPYPPLITSTLQQGASTLYSFGAQTTMRTAQQLYEGIEIKGQGSIGLITYMRTDSTHLANDAIEMARGFISSFGPDYLPAKPNIYKSSNKAAQEAHEAIRPTDVTLTPDSIRGSLSEQQYKLYKLIWNRFVACQMTPAQWDSTAVRLGATNNGAELVFRCTGRHLAFDGFYKAIGVPKITDDLILPQLEEGQSLAGLQIDPVQKFTNPPARYSEASLVKKLEAEGIGRPSTYASIIQVIQNRNYVEKTGSSFEATDLGMVVTDKLIEGFPSIMDIGYTRWMEDELDAVEEQNHDWRKFLHKFYGPFQENLEKAHELMIHAKAETEPAPYDCPTCGADTVYQFGRNGRFLSCTQFRVPPVPTDIPCPKCNEKMGLVKLKNRKNPSLACNECDGKLAWTKIPKDRKEEFVELAKTIPEGCKYAAPIDKEGKPVEPEATDIACPKCSKAMMLRKGRFGPFLSCPNYPDCDGIVNLDKKGFVTPPKVPPLPIDLECEKCDKVMNLRNGKRGPWLSCSGFPKCRGRASWAKLEEDTQKRYETELMNHEKENPQPTIFKTDGSPTGDEYTPLLTNDDSAPVEEPVTKVIESNN